MEVVVLVGASGVFGDRTFFRVLFLSALFVDV